VKTVEKVKSVTLAWRITLAPLRLLAVQAMLLHQVITPMASWMLTTSEMAESPRQPTNQQRAPTPKLEHLSEIRTQRMLMAEKEHEMLNTGNMEENYTTLLVATDQQQERKKMEYTKQKRKSDTTVVTSVDVADEVEDSLKQYLTEVTLADVTLLE
jgi:uncharacterized protein YaaQ